MLPLTLEKLMSFEVKYMLLEEIPVTTRQISKWSTKLH